MKKIFVKAAIIAISISLLITFSLVGCAAPAVEDVTTVAEETKPVTDDTQPPAAEEKEDGELPPVTIRMSHTMSEGAGGGGGWAEGFNKWLADHPNLTVQQEIVPGDEMFTKIGADAAADNLPDIMFYWGGKDIYDFAKQGMLLDIDKYLAVSKVLSADDIIQDGWDHYSVNGTKYGIPTEMFVRFMGYNKDIFDEYNLEAPKTHEDLLKIAEVLEGTGIAPLNMTSKGGNPAHLYFSDLAMQTEGGEADVYNFADTWKFDTESSKNAAKAIAEQRKGGVYPQDTIANGDWGPSVALYNEGKTAMIYSFPWMIPTLDTEILDKTVLIDVPAIPGGTVDPSTITQGAIAHGFLINAKSWEDPKKQPWLIELADWIMSDETQGWMLAEIGIVSVKLAGKGGIPADLDIPEFTKRVFDFSAGKKLCPHHWPNYPPSQIAHGEYVKNMDELIAGTVTADAFIENIQKVLDEEKLIFDQEQ